MEGRDAGLIVALLVVLAAGVTVGVQCYRQRQRKEEELLKAQQLLTQTWEAYNVLFAKQEADKERMREIETADTAALIEQGNKSTALLETYQGRTPPSKTPGLFKEAKVVEEHTPVGLATMMMHYPEAGRDDDAARIEQIMMQRRNHHEAVKAYAAALFGYTKEKLEDHINVNDKLRQVVSSAKMGA